MVRLKGDQGSIPVEAPEGAGPPATVKDALLHPHRRKHGIRLTIASLLLIATALPIQRHYVPELERDFFRAINGLSDSLEPAVSVAMQLGNLLAVPALALAALVATRRYRLPLDLALSGTAAWLLARVVKEIVQRGRPVELMQDVVLRGPPAQGHGYVSGHAAVAAAMAAVTVTYLGPRGKVVVIVLAAIVGFGRIYAGVHLPLDVVGGAAMGWAIASLMHFVVLPEVTGEDPDEPEGER
ncbi:MAG TPA: phosphatase PAP2 family protein [Actinomycetota bacterium]|nr:phosphatase PAP2 family protein [Actinomycetota bacterium]